MLISFRITNQIIRCVGKPEIVADSKNYLYAEFIFTPDWDGITKTALFKFDDTPYAMLLGGDNTCVVPAEVIKSPSFIVSVVGGDRITANSVKVLVIPSGYEEGETPEPPTPDIYEQIIEMMRQQGVDAAAALEAQHAAEAAKDDAEDYAHQTETDRNAVAQIKTSVENTITEFETVTFPNAVQDITDTGDAQVLRVEQTGSTQVEAIETTGATQVEAVEQSGAEQIAAATEQADRAEDKADDADTSATKSESYAVGGTGTRTGENSDNSKYYSQMALNNILNGIDTHNNDADAHQPIQNDIRNVEAIARGKARSLVFDTREEMLIWVAVPENAATLEIGDNLYIRDIGVPDYWWDGTAPSELEAEAPDLINYPTKIEFYANLPLPIEDSDYLALEIAGAIQAGRIYYLVPDGTLGG